MSWEDGPLAAIAPINSAASIDWPAPTPIAEGLPPVPAFPGELMPEALRPWVDDASERLQCPPDFIAVPAMVAAGAVVGRACAVRPRRFDDWSEFGNIWGAIVAPPGLSKTPAFEQALAPIKRLAAKASEKYQAARADYEFQVQVLEARKADAKKKLGKATEAELQGLRATLDQEVPAPAARRLIVNDATVEKLGAILAEPENQRGVLYFRDELAGLLASFAREGHENDRSFFNEGWSGRGQYDFDRIGRGTVRLPAVCLSVLGGIQPEPLAFHLRAMLRGGQAADGFLQRLQLAVYPDAPTWKNVDRPPNAEARDAAFAAFERLAGLQFEPGPHDQAPALHFDDQAQEFFTAWLGEHEAGMRTGSDHPAFTSHLQKYKKLMPAMALLGHLVDVGHGAISLGAAQRAAVWCDLMEAHAKRLYASVMRADDIAARTLLDKIRRGAVSLPVVARDIRRKCWSGLSTPDDVDGAIGVLEAHGYLRRRQAPTGGRPRVEFDVHPSARPEVSTP